MPRNQSRSLPWLAKRHNTSAKAHTYVTDGPFVCCAKDGELLMLLSNYRDSLYMEALAYSVSGTLEGPWRQLAPSVGDNSDYGMPFQTFDNIRSPGLSPSYVKIRDTGDTIVMDQGPK